jgi:hypothetical protein
MGENERITDHPALIILTDPNAEWGLEAPPPSLNIDEVVGATFAHVMPGARCTQCRKPVNGHAAWLVRDSEGRQLGSGKVGE